MDKAKGEGGALGGLRILEFAGVGPGPFCAMLLADMGAEVVTIDRVTPSGLGIPKEPRFNPTTRSRKSVMLDLKQEAGRDVALRLIGQADALIEGYRPGVMERLGLGPEPCFARNPKLVYGRMTGWGQDGPLADDVGHDLNYLAVTGVLSLLGPRDRPPAIPLNLLADLGGGGLYLTVGILAALLSARSSGHGQVVDAAMIDGVGSLMTHQFGFFASNRWTYERESNFLDGGAPWYNTYETADGRHVSVASVERKFYNELLLGMGLDPAEIPDQMDRMTWPNLKDRFRDIFRMRTLNEWCAIMDGRNACFAPVLTIDEATAHPHMIARENFIEVDGVVQPAPAPRFSRTPSLIKGPPPVPGADTSVILTEWGFSDQELNDLRMREAIC
ncbi:MULTISPECIES: CaiB/BaiF CoA-transferase family protein [unclassified Chelatococcus]|uniref:CaiB/BaiF CoA transferase family protein n=1 Tax=unclassified Chelatococcus TaxID=2638111 RepID=UPI001BCF5793|nr:MULTISPECIES: CaiB/BaiF CoA-transferase family protein [unclassified Chelatococcus]CAH1655284.1 Alpha-methylacyl-CoA racemase [Hyphomicrobiales bacterium]MBS7742631.1 CoA transferase [Chelatococcus sp. HY11]MBX3542251.1 CoA transferase [Chelatococcus sp.]MCO5075533.1 CoA transferase [Chelatococcus sp.]CAH1695407.1 Alpha-methylacyl-CoA racemase [Hyphomicrobiales bacterium]